MSAQHTPRPWSRAWVYGAIRHINKNVDKSAFLDDEDSREIEDGKLNAPNVRINPADADLITAAPDLLAALRELIERRERACAELGGHPDGSDGRYARARALLARLEAPHGR